MVGYQAVRIVASGGGFVHNLIHSEIEMFRSVKSHMLYELLAALDDSWTSFSGASLSVLGCSLWWRSGLSNIGRVTIV